ncbi:siderophore-interacting protein [Pseudarthrobacter sp. J1763]|uniref:siderophore-interacting protein n=1 Tax=Pseudarthrobacter sp. J1763 TaxID=3420445 RepID=UPI003D26AA5E
MSTDTQKTTIAAVEPMVLAFNVTVSAIQKVGANFLRITFGGYELRDFGVHGPCLDLRIKLMIPSKTPSGGRAPLPSFNTAELNTANASWYQQWLAMDPEIRGDMRTYTVREARLDGVYPEIDVDFVIHVDAEGHSGPAAAWALEAQPGDRMVIIGPNNHAGHCITAETYSGIEFRPGMAQRVLLAGDETAVPAISAILESLPVHIQGEAFLEVPEAADFQDISTQAAVQITWLARGAALGRSRPHGELLQEAVRSAIQLPGWVALKEAHAAGPEPEDVNVDQDILWETPQRLNAATVQSSRNPNVPSGALPFYAWLAGEAGVIKELRRYLVRDVGIDRKQVAFMGYWRAGKAEL